MTTISDPSTFDAVLPSLQKPFLLLICGDHDAEGNSWCGDCRVADPIIRRVSAQFQNIPLVEAPVGGRDDWKGKPNHPYRKHKLIQAQAIPTLILWGQDGPIDLLVEAECAEESKVVDLLNQA
eukprot:TRINITY_DN4658_c0_g1_i1.p2 TRINITY_DN4658_c0_g1~~TRINITY_DN4658_c0_g1_i1.p2  ORF type:complete len:123 (-),score=48.29 TRINITY_DN4658_c0_g1_i1:7-375(-)